MTFFMDIYFVSWHIKRIYETAGRWTDEADSKRLMLDEAIHPLLQWPGARDTCRSSSNHSHVLSLSTNESQVFTCHHWQLRMLGLAWPRLLTSAHLASLRCTKLLICQKSRSIICLVEWRGSGGHLYLAHNACFLPTEEVFPCPLAQLLGREVKLCFPTTKHLSFPPEWTI